MLLGARKPSRSVTAASLLIKYDYSVIELGNMIFRKAVEFFWYIAWKDLMKETNLNGRQDSFQRTLILRIHRFQPNNMCYVRINGGYFLLKQTEKISICLPTGVSTRHTSDLKRPCFTSTTTAGKGTSYSGLLSKCLVLMLSSHLTITNVQVWHTNCERKFDLPLFSSTCWPLLSTRRHHHAVHSQPAICQKQSPDFIPRELWTAALHSKHS